MTVARKCSATPSLLLAVGGPGITASTTLPVPTRATLFTWKNRSLCVCVCVCVCVCTRVTFTCMCVVVMCGWMCACVWFYVHRRVHVCVLSVCV